jgi:hypothetical protein
MTDDTQTTEVKTMWSETLLEALYVAMEKNKGNKIVIEIIKDLRAKGYENDYLIEKVQKKVGPEAATRLKNLLFSIKKQSGKARQRKSTASSKGPGIMTKIKGFFK